MCELAKPRNDTFLQVPQRMSLNEMYIQPRKSTALCFVPTGYLFGLLFGFVHDYGTITAIGARSDSICHRTRLGGSPAVEDEE